MIRLVGSLGTISRVAVAVVVASVVVLGKKATTLVLEPASAWARLV